MAWDGAHTERIQKSWTVADHQSLPHKLRKHSPHTNKLIAASIQWAERIMEKIDEKIQGL